MTSDRCRNGHPRTPRNVQIVIAKKRRIRRCRLCHNAHQRRRYEIIRQRRGMRNMEVECRNGHARTPENTATVIVRGQRCRYCRICRAASQERARQRMREAGKKYDQVAPLLVDVVAAALGRIPRRPGEVASAVRDEYGSVSERQVYRALAELRRRRRAVRLGVDRSGKVHRGRDESGYVLARAVRRVA